MTESARTERGAPTDGVVRHAAAIALLIGERITPNGAFDKSRTKAEVLKAAAPPLQK